MDTNKTDTVLKAIELLGSGFPLSTELEHELEKVGINVKEFTREFEIKASSS